MKKLLFGSVAFVALIAANAASAADLGLPVKSRALEPEWNWFGLLRRPQCRVRAR